MTDEKAEADKGLTRRTFLPRLLRTSAFRYTAAFFILFCLSVSGLGYYVFSQTLAATNERLDEELVREIRYFAQINSRSGNDGAEGLNTVVNEIARRKIVQKDAIYMVMLSIDDGPFMKQQADIERLPDGALTAEGLFEFEYDASIVNADTGRRELEKRPAVGRIGNFLYSGLNGEKVRAVILTARDVNEVYEIRDAAVRTVVRVGVFTVFLALVLGVFYTSTFLGRVEQIGQTVRAIRDGDLSRRIGLRGTRDEFDTLSENINGMLDQIERLMTGMRQVSDNIAHDLRSPLTRIKARLDQALIGPDADHVSVLEQTTQDVERLLATFNALLSITRIESGEGGGTAVPVDITAVAEEMLELYEPAADDAGFCLIGRIKPSPVVMGSRELLSQAIANLLDNALKYARWPDHRHNEAPEVPTIELLLAPRPGGGVLLSVMDNGPGVPEADYERIQRRFVRLETSRSTTGNGLGLSLVAAIALRHGAQLSIGRGLPHHPDSRALVPPTAYGLGVRIAFPPPGKEPKK